MKFKCPCGAIIADQTDNLPHKAHLIPDQEWFSVYDAIDNVIDDAKAGILQGESAYTEARNILRAASQSVYQCQSCGRLFIYDRQNGAHTYAPANDDASKEILRSRLGGD